MTTLFSKKDLTDPEYIVKYALTYLGMKKIKDESIEKILKGEENA
jgi:myosin-crossreactive antigen